MTRPSTPREEVGADWYARVYTSIEGRWTCDLLTRDGHVVASDTYENRSECVAAALTHGVPVKGLPRTATAKREALPAAPGKVRTGLIVEADGRGLWRWRRFDRDGVELDASDCAFLTRDECVADARKRSDRTGGSGATPLLAA